MTQEQNKTQEEIYSIAERARKENIPFDVLLNLPVYENMFDVELLGSMFYKNLMGNKKYTVNLVKKITKDKDIAHWKTCPFEQIKDEILALEKEVVILVPFSVNSMHKSDFDAVGMTKSDIIKIRKDYKALNDKQGLLKVVYTKEDYINNVLQMKSVTTQSVTTGATAVDATKLPAAI